MSIPIQNIYYLLSYAWDKAELQPADKLVSSENSDAPINLLTAMLLPEVQQLVAQGLATDFIAKKKTVRGIKGKLLLHETFRNGHVLPGKTICVVEEQSPDIIPNQIIKSVLNKLIQTTDLSVALADKVKRFLPAFAEVSCCTHTLPNLILPRHQTARYQYIIDCCTFILENLLPAPEGKGFRIKSLLENKKQMAKVFEAFVRNFYRREQRVFKVKSEKLKWQGQGTTPEAQRLLPAMFTDISLQSASRKIIIDIKFYKKALIPHYKKERLISKHLYQLFTYLHHSPLKNSQQQPEGILLYPVVTEELNLEYSLSGYKIRVCTINLNQSWMNIKSDLLKLIA